jgi:hypothetical protein
VASTRALSIAVPRTDNPLARSVERQLRRCERMADDSTASQMSTPVRCACRSTFGDLATLRQGSFRQALKPHVSSGSIATDAGAAGVVSGLKQPKSGLKGGTVKRYTRSPTIKRNLSVLTRFRPLTLINQKSCSFGLLGDLLLWRHSPKAALRAINLNEMQHGPTMLRGQTGLRGTALVEYVVF